MKPRCGGLYEARIPGAGASHLVVLTEDDWNDVMADSVVVPAYARETQRATLVLVPLGTGLEADCTRVQSMPHEFVGPLVGRCAGEPWARLRLGVRRFLDVDRRIARQPRPELRSPSAEWWPRQDEIHFASNLRIGVADKLYATVSDDDWNSQPGARHAACVRLTSRTKPWRSRWEVDVAGSHVVAGDLYAVAFERFERNSPPAPYPQRVSDEESSAIAVRQRAALSLR